MYLRLSNINMEDLQTEQVMGGACSRSKVCSLLNTMSQNAGKKIDDVVVEAIINTWQLV